MNRQAILSVFTALLLAACTPAADPKAGGKHSSGREMPALPEIKQPVMFNTPEADKVLSALQVFPPDNPWNEDVSKLPVHASSKNIVASIGADKPIKGKDFEVVQTIRRGS